MNTSIKLLCLILVLDCGVGQLISELKCNESASYATDAQSFKPHLVEIVRVYSKNSIHSNCLGTLISHDYVLTTASCVYGIEEIIEEHKIRKAKLPAEQYSNDQLFSIKRTIPFELYNASTKYESVRLHNIGLIQLTETIPYHNSTSIFRPACLWLDYAVRASYRYSVYETLDGQLQIKTGTFTGNDVCLNRYHDKSGIDDGIRNSHICFNTNLQYSVWDGGPVEGKVKRKNYVFGIADNTQYAARNIRTVWAVKISKYIGWIESIVWPDELDYLTCGRRKIQHKPLMTYALPTYHGEFPWHVALYKIESNTTDKKYICGGTIINNRVVLTAAHCVFDSLGLVPADKLSIVAGTHHLKELPNAARFYTVEKVIPHEDYTSEFMENDIALLKINEVIEFSSYILPICLNNITEYSSTIGTVAGWGREENDDQSDVLRQGTFPIRTNFDCRDSNRQFFPNYLNDYNYCAGYENGTNVCSGDSGGSMIFLHKSQWHIKGIVSLGVAIPNTPNKCDVMQMALFTDVPKFYSWIEEKLHGSLK